MTSLCNYCQTDAMRQDHDVTKDIYSNAVVRLIVSKGLLDLGRSLSKTDEWDRKNLLKPWKVRAPTDTSAAQWWIDQWLSVIGLLLLCYSILIHNNISCIFVKLKANWTFYIWYSNAMHCAARNFDAIYNLYLCFDCFSISLNINVEIIMLCLHWLN